MRSHIVLLWVALGGTAYAADPTVTVDVKPRVPAWSSTPAKVTVTNTTGAPIVPLAIELTSAAGTLSAWGLEGTCHGAVRGCSIQMRWAFTEMARRRTTWELLLGRAITQQMGPPDPLDRDATERLVGLEPIAPGETIELQTPLLATYEHGDKLTATLRYITVDPATLPLCAPASQPQRIAFVPCKPVTKVTAGTLYVPEAELAKARKTTATNATFTIEHPSFDIDAARKRAKVAAGSYGYAPATQQWILVDDARARTRVVGRRGAIEDLPGNWLEQLLALQSSTSVTVYWNAASTADVPRIEAMLRKAKISVDAFSFKGHTDPTRLVVTFEYAQRAALATSLRALGYRMDEHGVTK